MWRNPLVEPDLTQLQQIFNQRRAQAGQTYDQLAEASGVARRTLLYIGTGKSHGELRSWLMLSQTWNIPLDELLGPVWRTARPATNETKRGIE